VKKTQRISNFVEGTSGESRDGLSPYYEGYFRCFNEQRYYEAHDVLEHLWLQKRDNAFFKGLIQVAGAFVHLQKQFLRPLHPKDGKRLRPAVRLFELGMTNLAEFRPHHMSLDVEALCALCSQNVAAIVDSDYARNPWTPDSAPVLRLEAR
jgi:hypothetical protein